MTKRQTENHALGGSQPEAGDTRIAPPPGNLATQGGEVIIRNSEILEGKPYLAGTRMGVHAVIGYWQAYRGDAERILREFPHLTRAQIDAALAFYRDDEGQRAEIDEILRRNRASCGAAPTRGITVHERPAR